MIELIVVVAILAVLLAILIPIVNAARQSARSVDCLNKLRGIGRAFQAYAVANQGRLPDPAAADESWEQMLIPYGLSKVCCPADSEICPAVGSSYDWRDTGIEATTLAGTSWTDVQRRGAVLAMEALPGWHVKGKINVVLVDGSTLTMDQFECFKDLATPISP